MAKIDKLLDQANQKYGDQLKKLNPEAQFDQFTPEALEELVVKQKPILQVMKRKDVYLPTPTTPTIYYSVFLKKHPEIPDLYPQLDPFSLSESQLRDLLVAQFPEEVLGEVDNILLRAEREIMRRENKKSGRGYTIRKEDSPRTSKDPQFGNTRFSPKY